MPFEQSYYKLCACEIGIVLIGLVSITAAVVSQILVLLVIFRDFIIPPHAYQPVRFTTSLAIGTIVFSALLLFFRHTSVPLLFLAGFTLLSLLVVILSERRIQQYKRGIS